MARYDEEDLVFELLQLPHDLDCHGLKLIFEQVRPSHRSRVNLIAVRTLRLLLSKEKACSVSLLLSLASEHEGEGL